MDTMSRPSSVKCNAAREPLCHCQHSLAWTCSGDDHIVGTLALSEGNDPNPPNSIADTINEMILLAVNKSDAPVGRVIRPRKHAAARSEVTMAS